MKKILITGGNGYLARNLNRLLTQKGYNIIAPGREELDILNCRELQSYLKQHSFDAIINCAIKGGMRNENDTFENVYIPNIKMFENLTAVETNIPIISFGSGAEFDKRLNITLCKESHIFSRWPIDPYGLSKNITSIRSPKNMWILRLFGCFNYDEPDCRFIKSSISNIKNGEPIEVHQNKIMDFFYLDDIVPVIEYILNNENTHKHINLVYNKKMDLIIMASEIYKYAGISNCDISLKSLDQANEYTGNGDILNSLNLPLIGLYEGIKRTVNKLLCPLQ